MIVAVIRPTGNILTQNLNFKFNDECFSWWTRENASMISLRGKWKTRWERLLDSLFRTFQVRYLTRWWLKMCKQICANTKWRQDNALHLVVAEVLVEELVKMIKALAVLLYTLKTLQEADRMVLVTQSLLWHLGQSDKRSRILIQALERRCHYWKCWLCAVMKTTKITTACAIA